jgi:hypothetical protein
MIDLWKQERDDVLVRNLSTKLKKKEFSGLGRAAQWLRVRDLLISSRIGGFWG